MKSIMSFKEVLPCFCKYKHWHVFFLKAIKLSYVFSAFLCCLSSFLCICILERSNNENGNTGKRPGILTGWLIPHQGDPRHFHLSLSFFPCLPQRSGHSLSTLWLWTHPQDKNGPKGGISGAKSRYTYILKCLPLLNGDWRYS